MLPERLSRLMQLFARLPGVGEKTAQRYCLFLATEQGELARQLGDELLEASVSVGPCQRCGNLAEVDEQSQRICRICRDNRRDP